MTSYETFASVYDMYMDNVPYDSWKDHVISLLREYQVTEGVVTELGCGTGKMTRRLADAGFDMIGIDNSYDMLSIAMEQPDERILYLCQDMREMELYGTSDAMVSICDSMNYLTSYEDLVQVFRLVNKYLEPDGVFVFDVNTEYKYKEILADNVFAENREEGSFIWENEYDEETKLNYYYLTLYIQGEKDTYQRYEEEHVQRAHSLEEIKAAIEEAGMKFELALDVDTMGELTATTERMYIVAREYGKNEGE